MSDLTTAERDNIALGQRLECAEARIEALEAALRLGCYMTACAGDGEYQIKIGFASLVDMQTAHFALVTVLAPEQDKCE